METNVNAMQNSEEILTTEDRIHDVELSLSDLDIVGGGAAIAVFH